MRYTLITSSTETKEIEEINKEVPLEKIILIQRDSKPFKLKIPTEIKKIEEDVVLGVFKIINEVIKEHKPNELLVYANDVDEMNFSLINAGFSNGIKVLSRQNNQLILLPLLKFTNYKEIVDKKREIINLLYNSENIELGLEAIGKQTRMSAPLVSYHINGNMKSEGLKELMIVTSREESGKSYIKLTTMGLLVAKGYIWE